MNWKPHTERPDRAPTSVLIASTDDEGGYFLLPELYSWNGAEFRDEDADEPPCVEVFWWISESDVLEGLPK